MSHVFTAAELLACDFPPETAAEFRDRILNLVDAGDCHPLCLFGMEAGTVCGCRCEGLHHALMRTEEPG